MAAFQIPPCPKCYDPAPQPVDPLDVVYDGVTLRVLLECDERACRENHPNWRYGCQRTWTTAQRAAVSAHWSAELSAKVAASTAADKAREPSVVVDLEDPCPGS